MGVCPLRKQGQSPTDVVHICDGSAEAVQMPVPLSQETSSGADEEGEDFDSFTLVKVKRKCRAPPGLRAPPKPSPPPTPATPPEKRKLSKQEIRDAGNAQLLKVLREDLARAEASLVEKRKQLEPHLVLERREKRKAERLKFREGDWPSSLEVKFDNAEPSFPPSCPSSCIESARQILVLHAVCDRLESVEPCRRPRSLKSFENFTRKARSIRTYTLDWQAVAAALGLSLQYFPQECKETPTELQLAQIRKRFEVVKATGTSPPDLQAWIEAESYVAKFYSAEEILAELRKVGILSGPDDFGASMVEHSYWDFLPKTQSLPVTAQEASKAMWVDRFANKNIVSLATFKLRLPQKGTRGRGSIVGLLLGRRGSRIKAELEALKQRLAAAEVPVSKVLCSLGRRGCDRCKWRMSPWEPAFLKLTIFLPMGPRPVDQSFEVAKDIVVPTLEQWYKDMVDQCDHWDDVYTERLERFRVENDEELVSARDRIRYFLEEMQKQIQAEIQEPVASAKTLSSERWEQQIYGRLRDVRHRQEQEDKIQRRVRMAPHNRRSGRGRGMLAPAQVARVERRRRMDEVDDEPSAWDFTCK
mmetsp:Transcript_78593/g.172266  ORF Transcript_78593/g.172266 Transcript_78593/m.172266 type:complete len:587 (+) Transcript_78593:101-1861(+)